MHSTSTTSPVFHGGIVMFPTKIILCSAHLDGVMKPPAVVTVDVHRPEFPLPLRKWVGFGRRWSPREVNKTRHRRKQIKNTRYKTVCVVFTLNPAFYPNTRVHPVSVLISYPRYIVHMWSQTVRQIIQQYTGTHPYIMMLDMSCQPRKAIFRPGFEQ